MKKTVFCIFLALLMVLSALPIGAGAAQTGAQSLAAPAAADDLAQTGATTYNVTDANHLRSALQTNGDITVNVKNDIEFTMPDGYQWSQYNGKDDGIAYWTVIAPGNKTINLNGHRLYITDNQITKVKYNKVTYSDPSGGSYTLEELTRNGYVREAFMFRIDANATLTVNGYWSGSEVMFDAQMPSESQLIDYQVVTQRSLFELNGGRLYINGGEYQAGRRKTVYVSSARLKTEDWNYKEGVLWPTTHYYGNGEYAIGGCVVSAVNGEAYISGGTLIAHGFDVGSNNWRNAVLRTVDGHIFMYDGTLKGYCGAHAVQEKGMGWIWIYGGKATADAREMYLFPGGRNAVSTESNYCAVPVSAGKTGGMKAPYGDEDTKSYINSDRMVESETTYSPENRTIGKPNWEDGSTDSRTILTGTTPYVFYEAEEGTYFPTESIPGVTKRFEYFWSLQKKNANGNWSTVTGWLSSGANNYTKLSPDSLESGVTYRISAKRDEYWSSTHNYTCTITNSESLVFTVMKPADYVISSVNLTCPAPVGGQALNFNTAQVTKLPDYTTCTQIVWYKNGTKLQYQGDKAVTGENYEVWINLKTSVGSFAHWSSMQNSAKINGQKAGVTGGADASEMTFRYTFTNIPGPAQVKKVAVTLAQEPAVGKTPSYEASENGLGYMIEDYDYSPYQNGVAWFYTNGGEMKSTETFKAGNSYTVKISLVPENKGYEFATSGLSGTLNGKTAVVEAYNPSTETENICVSYTFTLPAQNKKITGVELFIDEPKAGQSPSYAAYIPYGADYEVEDYDDDDYHDGVAWYNEDGSYLKPGDTFKAGKHYTVKISMIPAVAKTVFDVDNMSGFVNDTPALTGVYTQQTGPQNIYVQYTFTVAEGSAIGLRGDVDGDGKVDIFDASSIQKSLAGKSGYVDYKQLNASDPQFRIADVDSDGKVDIYDVSLIQKWMAGNGAAQRYGIGEPMT